MKGAGPCRWAGLFLLVLVSGAAGPVSQMVAPGGLQAPTPTKPDDASATHTAISPAPRPTVVQGPCVTEACHGRFSDLPKKHGPLVKGTCLPCHAPLDGKHEFERKAADKYLCFGCHQPYPPGKQRHQDADDNCGRCHDPHGGDERFFLKGGSPAALCLDCHAKVTVKRPHHSQVEVGGCLSCHEMHHAAEKPLLRLPQNQVCLRCHDQIRKGLEEEQASVHKPVTEDCMQCHDPHGGVGEAFLKAELLELCRQCHADRLSQAFNAKFPHRAVLEGEHCINCHDPHFSRGRWLLKRPMRELCLSCHDRTYTLADGSVLADVKAQVTESRYVHGPARQGSCNPCHDPHGSDFPRLLKYDFPCAFYAPFDESRYELCFRCHDRQMVEEPLSSATRFRNGQRNLHFLHVNQQKGRTCRACHHEHASNNPLRIRETVPFGKWTMTITYRKNPNGGTCQNACHTEYGYDRVDPIQNSVNGLQATSGTPPFGGPPMYRRFAAPEPLGSGLRK